MSYQALYRTWRPQTFNEIVGQQHVTRTLANAVRRSKQAHAYLFCGPRGTGKTTTAKVLAKALNCLNPDGAEPCNSCSLCYSINAGAAVDVLEIDAASNRGVDEVRDLREKVKFRPAAASYKVYIIDEVHMLTNEAFNALLKTLEEPPPHVVFVLATTEPHKVPLTIISRCQRFDFRRISTRDILTRLEEVVKGAGLAVEPRALMLIAKTSEGSLRDALSILDQVAALSEGQVTLDDVHAILGTVQEEILERMLRYLAERKAGPALCCIHELEHDGKDLRIFTQELTDYVRGLLLKTLEGGNVPLALNTRHLLRLADLLSKAEQEMKFASRQSIPLELAVVKFIYLDDDLEQRVTALERKVAGLPGKPIPPASSLPPRRTPGAPPVEPAVNDKWPEIMAEFKKKRPPAAPFLARATPEMAGNRRLILRFSQSFAREKIDRPENKNTLEEILSIFFPGKWLIECVKDDSSGEA
ncbi:MAG: DNA polymerase III subunit gamma/tau [Peptococcaceae bacterium]|nr:DNA polymerase III subunit gamma/tau [Peptococcaceae bacterium]